MLLETRQSLRQHFNIHGNTGIKSNAIYRYIGKNEQTVSMCNENVPFILNSYHAYTIAYH